MQYGLFRGFCYLESKVGWVWVSTLFVPYFEWFWWTFLVKCLHRIKFVFTFHSFFFSKHKHVYFTLNNHNDGIWINKLIMFWMKGSIWLTWVLSFAGAPLVLHRSTCEHCVDADFCRSLSFRIRYTVLLVAVCMYRKQMSLSQSLMLIKISNYKHVYYYFLFILYVYCKIHYLEVPNSWI